MAKSSTKKSASRSLVALIVLILGLGALAGGMAAWGSGQLTPRLGLDLEGGTELVLQPVLVGNEQVNEGQVNQAVDIIRQRIDANGVSEAEISTQGGTNIVVSIPGAPSAEQLDAIRKPSQLRFRAVFVQDVSAPTTSVDPSGTPTPSGTATTPATGTPTATATAPATSTPAATTPAATSSTTAANGVVPEAFRAATTAPTTPAPATTTAPAATPTATAPATPAPAATTTAPAAQALTPAQQEAALAAEVSGDLVQLGIEKAKADESAAKVATQFLALDCTQPGALEKVVDDPAEPMATCSDDGFTKYILGPAEIDGSEIADATSGYQPGPNGAPTSVVEVSLSFKDAGKAKFGEVTKRLYGMQGQPPKNQFAIVLDNLVITAPARGGHHRRSASITGNFTSDSAKALANQLKFGALPISFPLQTQDDITPQLGDEQLRRGLLAGAIGLLLVVIYSLFQYRALGLVTVASLVVAGA